MKKIEISIFLIVLIEASFLLLFFKDSFLNIILGTILGIILISLTKSIKKNKLTEFILLIISLFLYIIVLYKLSFFINYNILKNYSSLLLIISLIIISVYIASKKYHVFIKTTEIIFYLIIIIKIISFILSIPLIKLNYFIIDFNFNYHFIYIALFILFLFKTIYYISDYQIKKSELLLSIVNPLSIKLISLLVIGNTLSKLYEYPYVSYLKNIRYFDFIERMEGILSFEYLLCFIIFLSFLLLNIKKAIKWLISFFCTRKSL